MNKRSGSLKSAALESGRTFIHCRDGVDRTGTIVALYRINQEGWSADLVKAEAVNLGMRRIQVWMFDYIEDYYDPPENRS